MSCCLPRVSPSQANATMVGLRIHVSQAASSEEQRKRLDLLVDEASMLSFPASDPPAVFVEENEPTRGTVRAPASPREEDASGNKLP